MNEQVGWQGLLARLKDEAPGYAQLLPDLPRLLHQRLQRPAASESPALLALLAEQRRTNRLLQGLVYGALGFVAGMIVARLWLAP